MQNQASPNKHTPLVAAAVHLPSPSHATAAPEKKNVLPTTVLARVGWLDIALRSNHILEQVASTNCCNEFSNQLTGGKFFRSFRDHYGLKPHDIEFFAEHGEADTEHSNIGYELVEQFATSNELQVRVLKALRKGLGIWWALTDGVARECAKMQK